MRTLVASDLHGSKAAVRMLLEKIHLHAPDRCLLLGDFLYHGPRNPLPEEYLPSEAAIMLADIPCPTLCIRGNCDAEVDTQLLPFHLYESLCLTDGAFSAFACHGHHPPTGDRFGKIQAGSVLLVGHTHVPCVETRDGMLWWNPGSLALPKFGFPPTYGLLEQGVFRVLGLNDAEIFHSAAPDAVI